MRNTLAILALTIAVVGSAFLSSCSGVRAGRSTVTIDTGDSKALVTHYDKANLRPVCEFAPSVRAICSTPPAFSDSEIQDGVKSCITWFINEMEMLGAEVHFLGYAKQIGFNYWLLICTSSGMPSKIYAEYLCGMLKHEALTRKKLERGGEVVCYKPGDKEA